MALYILRRIALALPALLGLILVTFILSRVVPGDPAATLAGDAATPAQIADIRARYGLDKPMLEQATSAAASTSTANSIRRRFAGPILSMKSPTRINSPRLKV